MIANIPKKKIIFGEKEKERYNDVGYVKENSTIKIKIKKRLKIIVIIPVDIEEPRTTSVILIIDR